MSSSSSAWGVLRQRNFTLYLVSRWLSALAVQMQGVAVGWQVYALTGNALDLGLIGLAQFAPFVLLVLIAGQVADRADRRRILFLCYAAQCVCALLLLHFTLNGLTEAWPVFAVMSIYGSARAFMMPTNQAILPNLVDSADFPRAMAIASTGFQVAVITGPALGGLLYLAGPHIVYFVVSLALTLSMVMIGLARTSQRVAGKEPASLRTLLEGLRFVRSRPVVLGAISLDLFAVLFGGATALLPAYASDILHVGPDGLGLLRTAPGVGAAMTALLLTFFPITRRVGHRMFAGVVLFGTATIVFGMSELFYLSLAALFLLGAGDMVSVYIRQMLVQSETPDAIRGRVSAVNSVFIGASNELGEFESGMAVVLFGLKPAVVLGGVATLLVALLWMRGFPELRTMDRFPELERRPS
ncbi:MFS transporter [Methylococcus sp. EFPC2]|uniref:MFS transporter n=1 Tax=Methylococcus sp. EFPC2 TaxID=2812648 RepID=UPI001967A814|nr:MFS transporter [Methylococcus sp. EFPC2]QSA97936.1 MFS transporter [Methylococcus sp. EFPC2]